MDLLKALIIVSEKAANIARLCRQNDHLFELLIQKKPADEGNPRFIEDFKTLADVLIQQLVKHDIGDQFPNIVDSIKGEENNIFSNKLGETICVEIKENIEETASLLGIVLNNDIQAAELLATEVHKEILLDDVNIDKTPIGEFNINLENVGIWIDPIDSTAEYINGTEDVDSSGVVISGLKCVTVLIGAYDKKSGLPVIGVVNQPFIKLDRNQWTGCCFWGHPNAANPKPDIPTVNIVCISSSEDESIKTKLNESGYFTIEASGAGYKILAVLTGLVDAYVLTKDSTFKWDTCGPQAILRSLGGDIVIYKKAVENEIASIKYDCKETCNQGGIIAYRNPRVLNNILECLR